MNDPVTLREYVEALLHEHQRANEIAERERESSAHVLASELRDRILAGDARLAEHIAQQIGQIAAALESARREQTLVASAAKEAIEKAERATEKRFSSVNAFREQLSDQVAMFMPREVAESQITEMRKALSAVHSRLDMTQGQAQGASSTVGYMIAGATLVISIIVMLANQSFG